jgi:hypothetical protein
LPPLQGGLFFLKCPEFPAAFGPPTANAVLAVTAITATKKSVNMSIAIMRFTIFTSSPSSSLSLFQKQNRPP